MQASLLSSGKKPAFYYILLFLVLAAAAVSTIQGGRDAFHRSQDFQWSGERVLLHHIDPWAEYLRGDPHHQFVAAQIPNYLPILYVLIFPVGFLPLSEASLLWFSCNLVFAITSAVLAGRFYGMRRHIILITGLMLAATPTRTTFGNGQQGLLVLFLWSLSLLSVHLTDRRSLLAGVSYFKYNFGPPAFFTLLFRGGVRAAFLSTIPAIISTFLVWFWLTGGHQFDLFLKILREPLLVARTGYSQSNDSNLMDVLEFFLRKSRLSSTAIETIVFAVAMMFCLILLFLAIRRYRTSSTQWQLALMAVISVGLFRHHSYDAVVLLFPLCYLLRLWRHRRAQLALCLVAYLWYFQRIVDAISRHLTYIFILQFVLLMIVLWIIWGLRRVEDPQEFAGENEETTPCLV